MGVLRRKIWTDLWDHRRRTLRVVMIIAMGAFVIGMVVGTRDCIVTGMEQIWQQSSPAMIHLRTFPAVDDDTLAGLERVRGVTGAEGFTQAALEWRLPGEEDWAPGTLTARDDYEDQRYAKLDLISGDWSRRRTFAVGQGSDSAFGMHQGGKIQIRINDREHVVDVGGVIYDPKVQPPGFGGNAQFHVSRNRLKGLTGDDSFNRPRRPSRRLHKSG